MEEDVQKTSIPIGVYYNSDASGLGPNFYSVATKRGMGWEFWRQWKDRHAEFPQSREEALANG